MKRTLSIFLILLFVLSLTSCNEIVTSISEITSIVTKTNIVTSYVDPTYSEDNILTLKGVVKSNDELLSGVTITYGDQVAYSMRDGSYIIRGASSEGGKVTFSKDGFFDYRYKLLESDFNEGVAMININLTHKVSISGVVRDTWGNLLSGATVKCGNSTTQTDEFGRYTLGDLTVADHLLEFSKSGYNTVTRLARSEWYNESGELLDFECNLHLIASLSGTVRDANGNPLEGVKVICGSIYTFTDSNGNYYLSGICPEPASDHQNSGYDVEFSLDGYTYKNAQYRTISYGTNGKSVQRIVHPVVDFYTNNSATLDVILVSK